MVPELPPELWASVISHLTEAEIRALIPVSRVFLDAALNLRYRFVRIGGTGPASLQKLAGYRNLNIATRVRTLELMPYAGLNDVQEVKSHGSKLDSLLHRLKITKPAPPVETVPIETTLSTFTNVVSLILNITDPPPDVDLHRASGITLFSNNLTTLSLRGHLKAIGNILVQSPSTAFPCLNDLSIELNDRRVHVSESRLDSNDLQVINTLLAPFMNGLSEILEAISLAAWPQVDISPLFERLDVFPNLRRFSLLAPFNTALSINGDASGLTRFLVNHLHLQSMDLRIRPTGLAMGPGDASKRLASWFRESQNKGAFDFTRLKRLQMYAFDSNEGMQALLNCLRESQKTLEHVVIRDYYMSYDKVEGVLNALGDDSPLRVLRINIENLNLEIMELFAKKVPHAHRLRLFVKSVDASIRTIDTVLPFSSPIMANWQLHDLDIWLGGTELDAEIMQAIAQSVPSIQSFWNNGDMEGRKAKHKEDPVYNGAIF